MCRANSVRDSEGNVRPRKVLIGFPTQAAFNAAIQAWSGTHLFALSMIATVTAYQEAGPEVMLTSPRAMIFYIHLDPGSRFAENPTGLARAFQLDQVKVVSKGELNDIEAGTDPSKFTPWDIVHKQRKGSKAMVAGGPHGAGSVEWGGVPVVLVTRDASVAKFLPFVLYRLCRHCDPGPLPDADARKAFVDLRTLFAALLNGGLVVRCDERTLSAGSATLPKVGRMVAQKAHSKQRVWQAEEGWDWDAVGAALAARGLLGSNMSPAGIWRSVCGPA